MAICKYYFGQNKPGQVLKLIPISIVNKSVKNQNNDFVVKKFSTLNHPYTKPLTSYLNIVIFAICEY